MKKIHVPEDDYIEDSTFKRRARPVFSLFHAKETPFKQAHQAHKHLFPLQPAALVSVPYGFVLVRVRVHAKA